MANSQPGEDAKAAGKTAAKVAKKLASKKVAGKAAKAVAGKAVTGKIKLYIAAGAMAFISFWIQVALLVIIPASVIGSISDLVTGAAEDFQGFLTVNQSGVRNTVQYAIKGVDANMFQNFILSGKATLHTLDGMFLSDNVLKQETFDAHKAIIGICRTRHSGLVFYPASKKDYREIVSFLEKKQKTEIRQNDILQKIKDIQTKQECDAANNQRMQDFIKEFAEESVEEKIDTPDGPTLHLDQEIEPVDLKPSLQL